MAVNYPTNEVNFQLVFKVKHEAGHNLRLKFSWISLREDSFDMTENETPTFKEWQLLQIEGEELQPI